eukprot:672174-Alexandrium_andersonii.AAC.1
MSSSGRPAVPAEGGERGTVPTDPRSEFARASSSAEGGWAQMSSSPQDAPAFTGSSAAEGGGRAPGAGDLPSGRPGQPVLP